MFVDKESEAGEDMEAMLARSQSSRHYPRTNLGLENMFQRNTPRSKSLGRPKGTRKLLLQQHSLGKGSSLLSVFIRDLWSHVSMLPGGGWRKTFTIFFWILNFYCPFLCLDIHIIRHYCRRIDLQNKNSEEFILRGIML